MARQPVDDSADRVSRHLSIALAPGRPTLVWGPYGSGKQWMVTDHLRKTSTPYKEFPALEWADMPAEQRLRASRAGVIVLVDAMIAWAEDRAAFATIVQDPIITMVALVTTGHDVRPLAPTFASLFSVALRVDVPS